MGIFSSKKPSPQSEPIFKKVVMLGLDNAGKTTIINRLKSEEGLGESTPTIGFDIHTILWKDCELKIFDVGGAATHFWSHYYSDLDALVFVVDSTDKARLEIIKMECKKIRHGLKGRPYVTVILLNKQDLKEAIGVDKFLDYTQLDLIFESDIILQKCSGLENWGLKEAMDKLTNYFRFERKKEFFLKNAETDFP